jgi:hypothetical protein
MVSFKRDSISLSSYDADSIRTTLETWADGIAALINPVSPASPGVRMLRSGLLVRLIQITTS